MGCTKIPAISLRPTFHGRYRPSRIVLAVFIKEPVWAKWSVGAALARIRLYGYVQVRSQAPRHRRAFTVPAHAVVGRLGVILPCASPAHYTHRYHVCQSPRLGCPSIRQQLLPKHNRSAHWFNATTYSRLRRQLQNFRFVDGALHRINHHTDGAGWVPVVPRSLRSSILQLSTMTQPLATLDFTKHTSAFEVASFGWDCLLVSPNTSPPARHLNIARDPRLHRPVYCSRFHAQLHRLKW